MSVNNERYGSGMMLPPATEQQRWLEAQRIMADIIDQSECDSYGHFGDRVRWAEGTLLDEHNEEREFMLIQYSNYTYPRMQTEYSLQYDEGNGETREFYIDEAMLYGHKNTDPSMGEIKDAERRDIYSALSKVALAYTEHDMHGTFEEMVTSMAAHERYVQVTGEMMNWQPEDWDQAVSERQSVLRRHHQARINPTYLAVGAFNARFQRQLPSPPRHDTD